MDTAITLYVVSKVIRTRSSFTMNSFKYLNPMFSYENVFLIDVFVIREQSL